MQPHIHTVQYYETDKMGVTYHGNYIHWMEEARISLLEQVGYSYARLEREGVGSPVTGISCKYIAPTTFADKVSVDVRIKAFNGVQMTLAYEMHKQDGTPVLTATSEHVFLDTAGHFVRLKRDFPEFYALMTSLVEEA